MFSWASPRAQCSWRVARTRCEGSCRGPGELANPGSGPGEPLAREPARSWSWPRTRTCWRRPRPPASARPRGDLCVAGAGRSDGGAPTPPVAGSLGGAAESLASHGREPCLGLWRLSSCTPKRPPRPSRPSATRQGRYSELSSQRTSGPCEYHSFCALSLQTPTGCPPGRCNLPGPGDHDQERYPASFGEHLI